MLKLLICLLLVCGLVNGYNRNKQKNNQLPGRSVIVQLFEWKWLDIADECERILGPLGYGAVQTSPASDNLIIYLDYENTTRPWYERYQVMSYEMETRSGDDNDFLEMTTRCNRAGVRIYVDVVFNHMTGDGGSFGGTAHNGADFADFAYYAVPYYREHFNQPTCDINNYDNATEVRVCQLSGLKDLNTSTPYVQEKVSQYLNKLISLGVAGFRVDAAKHMWPKDLRTIYNSLSNLNVSHGFAPNSRPYIYQEVSRGGAVAPDDYTSLGDVTEFTVVATLFEALTQKGLHSLQNFASPSWDMLPSESALVFVDNHDTQRSSSSLYYANGYQYQIATTFLLAHPYGQPRVMSSFRFEGFNDGPPSDANAEIIGRVNMWNGSCDSNWICEHRWQSTYQMVKFRSVVKNAKLDNWWDNGNNQIAFSRGNKGFVALNNDYYDLDARIQTGLPKGTYCDVITSELNGNTCTGRTVKVSRDGYAQIHVPPFEGSILAIHVGPESRMA